MRMPIDTPSHFMFNFSNGSTILMLKTRYDKRCDVVSFSMENKKKSNSPQTDRVRTIDVHGIRSIQISLLPLRS